MGQHDRKTAHVQVRGWHPLRPGLQACSPGKPFYDSRPVRRNRDTRSRNTTDATPDGYHAPMVWSDPLSLATTHGVSLPAGTEMFHFPAYPRNNKVPCRPMTAGGLPHSEILGSKPCWRLPEAYRILKRPSSVLSAKASTIRPSGRHTPRKNLMIAFLRQTTNHHTVKNDHKTIDLETRLQKIEPGEIAIKQTMTSKSSHCSRPLSSSQTTTHPNENDQRPTGRRHPAGDIRKTARDQVAGGGPGTQKHTHTTARRPPKEPAKPTISSTPARPHHSGNHSRRMGHTTDARPAS